MTASGKTATLDTHNGDYITGKDEKQMSRGPRYSKEDDAKLMAVYLDHPDEKIIDIAKKAQSYGICSERNTEALRDHISKIVNQEEDDEPDAPQTREDIESERAINTLMINSLEASRDEWKSKYEELLHVVLDTATLSDYHTLYLDFKEITRWLFKKEPDKTGARLEALHMEAKA